MPSLRRAAILLLIFCSALACDRRAKSTANTTGPRKVASLVPAATDMLLGMGAGDHLVAVSNYESAPEVKNLPRVGDYQTTDWERLSSLRPASMITQYAPDRLPQHQPKPIVADVVVGLPLERTSLPRCIGPEIGAEPDFATRLSDRLADLEAFDQRQLFLLLQNEIGHLEHQP